MQESKSKNVWGHDPKPHLVWAYWVDCVCLTTLLQPGYAAPGDDDNADADADDATDAAAAADDDDSGGGGGGGDDDDVDI